MTNTTNVRDITSRNTAYHGRMKAVIATAATTVVSTGTTCQMIVSQKSSNALVSLLAWETSEPENRSEWNPMLWRVRWSRIRSYRWRMPFTSKVHAVYSAMRQPTMDPRIWVRA